MGDHPGLSLGFRHLGTWTDPRYWVPEWDFEAHLEFLKKHRTVVPLSQLVDSLRANQPLPAGTVVLTFDDAYLDHATFVAPRLAELGLPATFFIPTDWVGRRAPWGDDLYSALRHRRNARLDLGDWGRFNFRWPGQLRRAYTVLADRLFSMHDADERTAVIEDVRKQLETYGHPPRRTMRWEELRAVAETPGITIGAHGARHLSMIELSLERRRAEIADGVAALEKELLTRPRFFAYPYGHYSAATDEAVAEFGFDAVAIEGADHRLTGGADRQHLVRFEVTPNLDVAGLARVTGH